MKRHDATELAYKNGYEQGKKATLDSITHCKRCDSSDDESCPGGRVWCNTMGRYMKVDGHCSMGKKKTKDK